MIEMALADVAEVTGGMLAGVDPAVRITGEVEIDSRKVGPGGLFVAFDGANVDGHDFASTAVEAGAVAVLGTRRCEGVPMVLVDDPLAALTALAREVCDRLAGRLTVIAVTGSSGKTTTKDMLAQVLGVHGPTVAPSGSFNNELGLPYTALRAGAATRFLVLEMGARGPGHIAHLCQVAPPQIGVVLNVGVAHVGEFGSLEATAAAKGELVAALPADGVAVLNADDPLVAAMAGRTAARVVGYGSPPADTSTAATADSSVDGHGLPATVRAADVTLDAAGRASYTLRTPAGAAPVRLPLVGAHQVANSLAVAAVARAVDMPVSRIADALGGLRSVSPRRMDVFDRHDDVTVIDDSYNANPASVTVALRALSSLGESSGRARRTLAVLGYLAELGHYEREGHEQVGRTAAELDVDLLVVVGDGAAPVHRAATAEPRWQGESVLVADQEQAVALLAERLRPGDVVLVKGSRYQTWDVADWLRRDAAIGGVDDATAAGGGAATSGRADVVSAERKAREATA